MEYNIDWNSNFLQSNNNNDIYRSENLFNNQNTDNDNDDDLERLKYRFGIEHQQQRMFESSTTTSNVTFDDIEKLSIRIAEHALEING